MIEHLPSILAAADLQPDLRELRDALWLSTHITVTARTDPAARVELSSGASGPIHTDVTAQPPPEAGAESGSEASGQAPYANVEAGLYATGLAHEGHGYIRTLSVYGPAVPALPRQLQLSRSLRPLRKRIPSRTSFAVDEAATAAAAAEEGIWLPVLRPVPSRWLDLTVIVDTAPSMVLWQQTITELQTLLEWLGAFRTIRIAAVDGSTNPSQLLTLHTRATTIDCAVRGPEPAALISYARQQAILVVTDAVGSAWRDGRMDAMLRRIGTSVPVAVAVVIPQRMWAGADLHAVAAELHSPVPGAANRMLQTRGTPATYAHAVPVPVMELSARWLAPWANIVAGAPGWRKSALLAAMPNRDARAARMPTITSADAVVRRFRFAASPTAFQLACYLSATWLILPMMRLVQRVMLPDSDPSHLAEVFLGGLLKTVTSDTEIIQYEFLPGVRDELNRYLLRDEMLDVLRETSQFAAERFGQRFDFAALLNDPEGTPLPVLAGNGSQPLAYIAASTLAKLGGRYRALADRLAVTNPAAPGNVTLPPTTLALNDPSAIHQADASPIELEADANAIKTVDDDLGVAGVQGTDDQPRQHPGTLSSRGQWRPAQHASHAELLESSDRSQGRTQFDAIVVPTNRPVEFLSACISLAQEAAVPLIVVCSRRVNKNQVIEIASRENVEVFAVDLPPYPVNPLGITFGTSTDEEVLAASSGNTRDLSTKRNLGLIIAKMLGWRRLMFLSDDIYGISTEDVEALAAALDDHNVSVLIPEEYPDNSVAGHAFRLAGGMQGTFASASGMGVLCDRDDLPFFPNIYNEDWFFFSEEASSRRIAVVGESRQLEYDPFRDPNRAVKEEFGDLLAEGLYARLDARLGISDVDEAYWAAFKASRRDFLRRVAESLTALPGSELDDNEGRTIRAAQLSIRAAQEQLEQIDSGLCQKFINLWQADLVEWRRYLTELPVLDSVESALRHLGLDYAAFSPSIR